MAHDVFISHSSVNKNAADAICHALEQNGVKCWIAPRDIPHGAKYGAEITKGLRECNVFLLVFSDEVNKSEAVQKEIERAVLGYKKPCLPFYIENVPMNDNIEFFISDAQRIDAFSDKHWMDTYPDSKVFDELVRSVKNLLGMSTETTPPIPDGPVRRDKKEVTGGTETPESKEFWTKRTKGILIGAVSLVVVAALVFGGIALWGNKSGNGEPGVTGSIENAGVSTSTPTASAATPGVSETATYTDEPSSEANSKDITVGNVIHFGKFDWIVLDVQNDNALIITKDTVEQRMFNETDSIDVRWENCTLRDYLNNEFLVNNFNTTERSTILETDLQNQDSDYLLYGVKPIGGNNTKDKLFLLSPDEFVKNFGKSNIDGSAMWEGEKSDWWLRFFWLYADKSTLQVCYVEKESSEIGCQGMQASSPGYAGVRPAMWIKLDGAKSTAQTTEPIDDYITIKGEQYSTSLSELFLANNNLTKEDIFPLQYMINLEVLELSNNKIDDITPLSNLTNLMSLSISNNQINNLAPLSNLPNLIYLDLSGNLIEDLTPLSELTGLTNLALNRNEIENLNPLSSLTSLDTLFLGDNNIRSLTALSKLVNLKYLYLFGNKIRDLTPLTELENLSELTLDNNPITDWSPVAHVKSVGGRP